MATERQQRATSAAIEYAVCAFKVAYLIVIGHSNCGGLQGCCKICFGQTTDLEEKASFLGRWLDILRPAYDTLDMAADEPDKISSLEKKAVLTSLENLMIIPFIKAAVEQKVISLHGLWTDIGTGGVRGLRCRN